MGNVTTNYVKSVNDIVVNSITQTLQTATSNYIQDQSIDITCTGDVLNQIANEELICWQSMLPALNSGQYKAEDISRICRPILCIGNNNVSISGAIFAETITKMTQKTEEDITNTISNNIKSFAQQESHGFTPEFLDLTTNNVGNISKQVINVLQTTVQKDIDNVQVIQNIKIQNMQITNVSQSAVQKLVSEKLLANSTYNNAVNQMASDLTAATSSIRNDTLKDTFITIAKVVAILLILGIIAWLVKKYQNRKKKR
jgi:hypothetical protein